MRENAEKHLKNSKIIKLKPYVIVDEFELSTAFDDAYEESKEEFRGNVIKLLESLIKDETLKILLTREIKKLNVKDW